MARARAVIGVGLGLGLLGLGAWAWAWAWASTWGYSQARLGRAVPVVVAVVHPLEREVEGLLLNGNAQQVLQVQQVHAHLDIVGLVAGRVLGVELVAR